MPTIEETVAIAASPDEGWRRLGDFGAVADWHPMLESATLEQRDDGLVRHVKGGDGSRLVERLEKSNEAGRRYTYRILESGLPVENYEASFSLEPAGDGTLVRWTARFDATPGADEDEASEMIRSFLRAGLEALK